MIEILREHSVHLKKIQMPGCVRVNCSSLFTTLESIM